MDDRERRKLSCKVETNLAVIERITDKQREALVQIGQDAPWSELNVTWSFDLPKDWLYVIAKDKALIPIYNMGISPEGEVHS